jgi:ATP-dependent Clp protease ATP-binding subunit ClpA
VVQKELKSLSDEIKTLGHTLEWTKEIEEWVLDKAHEKGMGARPFERFISKNIRTPIAEKLLKLKKPGTKKTSETQTLSLTLDKEGLKVK